MTDTTYIHAATGCPVYRHNKNGKYYIVRMPDEFGWPSKFSVRALLGGQNGEPYGTEQPRTANQLGRLYYPVPVV